MPKNKIRLAGVALLSTSVLLAGCGLFGGDEKEDLDPPQEVTYVEEEQQGEQVTENGEVNEEQESEETAEAVERVLYLIDKNGMVVPQSLPLPQTQEVAKQVVEYLVVDGPVSNVLPNGFRAVIPQGTIVQGVNIKEDGTAIVDFSKEFSDYKPEDEQKILQAVTYTLTQFENVQKVKLWINGHELTEMPVNGTPIGEGVSREDGINMISSSVLDITNTRPLTVYYAAENDGQVYYVPVTKRVSNEQQDSVEAAVQALIEGPSLTSGLLTEFQSDVKLIESPEYKDGVVTLNFNEAIFSSFDEEKKMISEHTLNALVLTVTEQPEIESVVIQVNGESDLQTEEGKALSEPVVRPEKVNTGSF
ncbi:GerMN domain-containing protein [Bacillus kexueae]|uniref:GerMN domain-containing protein n=1 Tax=Aeribacillus kexueae TaxID=2078952 RepID=UPI001FAF5F1F|nr:GerMN domain-containing protein [Bacillus kexueae]